MGEINEELDKSSSSNNSITGTTVGRYHSLPGMVISITLLFLSFNNEVLYLTTKSGVFYLPIFYGAGERRNPLPYHFKEHDHFHIINTDKYYAVNKTKISRHSLLCSGFFDTCESFKARRFDPLGCIWCLGTNEAVLNIEGRTCDRPLTKDCPSLVTNLSKMQLWIPITVVIGIIFVAILIVHKTISDNRKYQSVLTHITLSKLRSEYQPLFRNLDENIKIPLSRLQMITIVGEGHFGAVYRGKYQPKTGRKLIVACKMLNHPGFTELFREGQTMKRLQHRRIVKFIGMSLKDSMPIIVTEFMTNGNLQKYLKGYGISISTADLIKFALQIAEGMEYLHSQHFIHRDLAARNCMLDEHLQIKIADFGMARECNKENVYSPSDTCPLLPIRWMSIEALENNIFSFKLDVWSFGVVVWEIFSHGEQPFCELDDQIKEFLQAGNRLRKPIGCPEDMYTTIMLPCWSADMNDRKDFSDLVPMVTEILVNIQIRDESVVCAPDNDCELQLIDE